MPAVVADVVSNCGPSLSIFPDDGEDPPPRPLTSGTGLDAVNVPLSTLSVVTLVVVVCTVATAVVPFTPLKLPVTVSGRSATARLTRILPRTGIVPLDLFEVELDEAVDIAVRVEVLFDGDVDDA